MKIALLGFGVVGAAHIKSSQPAGMRHHGEAGAGPDYAAGPEEGLFTMDMADILNDPQIELVAEGMGGLEPAYSYVLAALRAGKHVVTANKLLVCQRFRELNQAAAESGVQFRYTASAGGRHPLAVQPIAGEAAGRDPGDFRLHQRHLQLHPGEHA